MAALICAHTSSYERVMLPGTAVVLGLLATNTIAQGDTREVGLDQLANDNYIINRAVPAEWPGGAAWKWHTYG